MNSTNGKEHRKQKRIPFAENILVDGTMLFKGIDISEGGLYVYTGRSFKENSIVNVTLTFKGKRFILAAKVLHNQPGIGMGLKFINLSDEQKAIIKRIIESTTNESFERIKEKKKILLIEDDDITRQIHKSRLFMEGFFVIEASDAIEAFNLLKKQTPNLIILDLYTKKMDGFKILSILKMSPEWKDLPVIVFSTKGTQDLMEKVIKAGADEFLNKMVTSPSKLAETAKAVLQRRYKI